MKKRQAIIVTIGIVTGIMAFMTVSWAQQCGGQGKGRGQGRGNAECAMEFTGAMDNVVLIQPKLDAAIDDEYHARAFYAAVLDQFGEIRPFSRIINAEQRHIEALVRLYEKYGLEVPADAHAGEKYEFADLKAAAQAGIDAEVANAKLYDGLFKDVTDPDVIKVFENLQWASDERHLPALERYLENGECIGCGQGNGGGKGRGRGQGNGGGGGYRGGR